MVKTHLFDLQFFEHRTGLGNGCQTFIRQIARVKVQHFDATEVVGRAVLVQQLFGLAYYDVEEVLRVATDQQTAVEVQLNNMY